MENIKFLAAAVKAFNSTTGEQLEVYGKRHHEILEKLRTAGVPRLDIVNSEQGFLVSINEGMPQFFNREEATLLAEQLDIEMAGSQLTSEDLW